MKQHLSLSLSLCIFFGGVTLTVDLDLQYPGHWRRDVGVGGPALDLGAVQVSGEKKNR